MRNEIWNDAGWAPEKESLYWKLQERELKPIKDFKWQRQANQAMTHYSQKERKSRVHRPNTEYIRQTTVTK